MNCRATADAVGGDDGRQVAHGCWPGREGHGQRSGRGARHSSDTTIVERHGVVGSCCVEACTSDRDRGCISTQGCSAAGHRWPDCSHLHRATIADSINDTWAVKLPALGRVVYVTVNMVVEALVTVPTGAIVERHDIVGSRGIKSEAVYQQSRFVGGTRCGATGDDGIC